MMAWIEATLRTRSMLCRRLNSSPSCPSFSACTVGRADASSARNREASAPLAVASAMAVCRSATRESAAVRFLTSAAISMLSLSMPENTTNAPPW
jgi:hypothetical protein